MTAQGQDKAMVLEPTALAEITRGEIDVQIATARKYPRSVDAFRKRALSQATENPDIAARCFYKLVRSEKAIEGPSIRLAEICITSWGNLRAGARCIEVGEAWITSQGVAHDLETNSAVSVESVRRITDKKGNRYKDDMIIVTQNANNAIALRNAAFKIIPNVYVQEIYQKVKQVAVGDAKTMGPRRDQAIARFEEMGVPRDRILKFLGRQSANDIDLKDLETLLGVYTAIKDGDTTVEEQFKVSNGKPVVEMPEEILEPNSESVVVEGRGVPPLSAVAQIEGKEEEKGRQAVEQVEEQGRESVGETPGPAAVKNGKIDPRQFFVDWGIIVAKLHKAGWDDDTIGRE